MTISQKPLWSLHMTGNSQNHDYNLFNTAKINKNVEGKVTKCKNVCAKAYSSKI